MEQWHFSKQADSAISPVTCKCCKSCAANAARARLTCPLLTSTISASPAWATPMLRWLFWTPACPLCEKLSLAILHAQIVLFSKPPAPSSPSPLEPKRKKKWSHQAKQQGGSEPRLAQCSPHNTVSPLYSSPARINTPYLARVAESHLVGLMMN